MKFLKIILPVLLMLPLVSQAQCRSFTKKKCLPELEGYVQNDNFNSAVLIPGDEAELLLTFYAGKEYRLLVCGHPVLGDLEFEVLDTDDEVIYTNVDEENEADAKFDFKVATTQQLIVRIRVPEAESTSTLIHEGCVSVMIGSKEN
ncbi:MAG: hypothetical protein P8H59_12370 [Flavobacteriales bacterium]|nr:hypothetical protein [Flavobacteriales bacterium]MDG1781743.1 hypothetical protein [Flavobacteriales bacterium]MDG2246282.1 hypothetical protein [Flavobacteriales bacterium]